MNLHKESTNCICTYDDNDKEEEDARFTLSLQWQIMTIQNFRVSCVD